MNKLIVRKLAKSNDRNTKERIDSLLILKIFFVSLTFPCLSKNILFLFRLCNFSLNQDIKDIKVKNKVFQIICNTRLR